MTTVATVKGRVILELMQETMKYLQELEQENSQLRDELEILQSDSTPMTISAKQVAESCGVSDSTVNNWLKTGVLKGRQINGRGRWLILWRDFQTFLDGDTIQNLQLVKSQRKGCAS